MNLSKQSTIEALKRLLAESGGPREGWGRLPRATVEAPPANDPVFSSISKNPQESGHCSAKKSAKEPGIGSFFVNKCQKWGDAILDAKCMFSLANLGASA